MTTYLPRAVTITGTDCSGSDHTANRTYTLSDTGVSSSTLNIIVNGASLHQGAGLDFTVSSSTITFLNIIDNTDNIQMTYWITITVTESTSLKYSTVQKLADIIGISVAVPSWDVGSTPTNEAVGTGDGIVSEYYLDHQNIISDSQTIYAAGTALTVTTHYTLDNDTGKITLTASGITACNTKAITAKYNYINNAMKNSYLVSVLVRAEKEVENIVNSAFTDGTSTNPDYPQEIEIQPSEGWYQDRFITKKKPLIDITSTLNANLTIVTDSIAIATNDGDKFPSSGYIIIDSEIITYTGITTDTLTGCSRGVLGTTAAIHSIGDVIHTTIFFRTDTDEGTTTSFTVQPWETYMYADANGLIYKYKDSSPDPLTNIGVANRIKIIYYYGYDSVPEDIIRLTLIIAKRMLMQDNVSKALIAGRNEFNPEMFNADEEEINRIIDSYIVLSMGNT